MEEVAAKVAEHYAPAGLKDRIASNLTAAGLTPGHVSIEDLERVDQLHVLGKEATLRLAERAGIDSSMDVLDVASGLGGPARFLAHTFGCRVTGVELAPEFVEAARLLTEWTGLEDRVSFVQGDATDLPFDDATFELVWTQHAQQNIQDKERFFSELFRVLKPDGRCVMHDIYGRAGLDHTYPAFWGPDASVAFFITSEETQQLLERIGFEIVDWRDTTKETLEWHEMLLGIMSGEVEAPESAGFTDLVGVHDEGGGSQFVELTENAIADMQSGAIGFFEAILSRHAKGR